MVRAQANMVVCTKFSAKVHNIYMYVLANRRQLLWRVSLQMSNIIHTRNGLEGWCFGGFFYAPEENWPMEKLW